MQKKTSLDCSKTDASPATKRIIFPAKNNGFHNGILPSEGYEFSKYAILKPKGNGKYEQVGGTMKEKKR